MDTKVLIKALVHSLCWGLGFASAYLILAHSNNKDSYGLIIGWWSACYVGYIVNIRINALILAIVMYIVTCSISATLGYVWFYHDAAGNLSLDLFIVILLQGFVFISPIFVNEFIKKILTG
jgi:hypothetical protein